jgi:hypothetical protein
LRLPLNPSKGLPTKEQLEGLTGGKNRTLPPDLQPGGGEYGGPRRGGPDNGPRRGGILVDPRRTGNELMPKPTNMGMPPKRDLQFTQRSKEFEVSIDNIIKFRFIKYGLLDLNFSHS